MASRTYDQLCPVAVSLDVLGDRWTMLILRDLLWRGPHGYQELLDANPGISPTLLSQRLESLTDQSLIEKVEVRGGRRVAAYRLTDQGRGVEPIIEALYGFGAGLMTTTPLSRNKLEYLLSLAVGNVGKGIFDLDEHRVRLAVDDVEVVVQMGPGLVALADSEEGIEASVALTQDALMALAARDGDVPAVTSGDDAAAGQLLRVLGRASG